MIETLGCLTVAALHLGAELAGPAAHRVGLEQGVFAAGIDLPDLQLAFLLEDAHENRAFRPHLLLRHFRLHLVGKLGRLRERGDVHGHAAGKQATGNRCGGETREQRKARAGGFGIGAWAKHKHGSVSVVGSSMRRNRAAPVSSRVQAIA